MFMLLPVIFQVVFGIKAIRKTTVLPLPVLLPISLGLQFICTCAGFVSLYSLLQNNVPCRPLVYLAWVFYMVL